MNPSSCPPRALGCSADGWRLLWLCHATNKEGRIFELGLVAGAVAPRCRQPMSLLGALGAVCLGWAGASSGTMLASPLLQTLQTPTTPCCQLGLGSGGRLYVLPKILHSREVFPRWVQCVAAQSALDSC